MRILRCHIENFGKLHDRTFEFTEPVSWICEENGWGKSTLAAFLRAMFYGLEGERRRSLEENERKRWQPWQGGIFGGQLTFETGERQYVISRIFREKESGDEFELRDGVTNRISSDFSSKIGEELFRINRDSFLRTVFISQSCLATAATDDIQEKIGRLGEPDMDSRFEPANRYLTELLHELTPKRSTGMLSRMQGEITALERQVREGSDTENRILQYEALLEQEQERLDRQKKELRTILSRQEESIRRQEQLVRAQEQQRKRAVWKEICENVADREREFEEKGKPFPDRIPDLKELDEQIASGHIWLKQKEELAGYSFSEIDRDRWEQQNQILIQETPSETEIRDMLSKEREYSLLRQEIALREKQGRKSLQAAGQRETDRKSRAAGYVVMMGAGAILLLAGGWLLWQGTVMPGMAVLAAAALSVCGGVWLQKRAAGYVQTDTDGAEQTPKEEWERKKRHAEKLGFELGSYLNRYGLCGGEASYRDRLYELRDRASVYLREQAEWAAYDRLLGEYRSREESLKGYLIRYGFRPETGRLIPQLYEIRTALTAYEHAEKAYREALVRQDAFLAEEGVKNAGEMNLLEAFLQDAAPAGEEVLLTMRRLQEQSEQVRGQMEDIQRTISGYREQLASLQENYEEWKEQKEMLEAKKKEREALSRKYRLLEQTRNLLTQARDSLISRYAGPVFERFQAYYEKIAGEPADICHMDASLTVTWEAFGRQRQASVLSKGYQDLAGLALRLALIDVMYQKEHPFLIMDDPFTNLDEKKAQAGLRLLHEISDGYQVIYFTCTPERTLKK